jgi:acetylornithine aminotransferase
MYGHKHGNPEAQTIVMEQAWHGRTLATLAATGSEKARKGFDPLPSGFIRVPYNDLAAVEKAAAADPRVQAVWLEVLQGEGGIRVADPDYLRALRRLCDDRGWLLMVDEVQCGIARTGKWFGYQWAGIRPDVVTLAKGLGSGVPIGAVVAGGRATGTFGPGNHGTTFGGGPLACRAGLETLRLIEEESLLANAAAMGRRIRDGFATALQGVAGVVAIRGQGLMIGIELDRPCGELVRQALASRLLINVTQERVIRLLPPLVIGEREADAIVDRLAPLVRAFVSAPLPHAA